MRSDRYWLTMFFLRVAAIIGLIVLVVWFANATDNPEPVNTVAILDDYEAPVVLEVKKPAVTPVEMLPQDDPEVPPEAPTAVKRYGLTDAERAIVEQVVMAESGAEGYDGMRLVAQCILNGCEKTAFRPDRLVIEYGYTKARKTPSADCKRAVDAVFDNGDTYTDESIHVFYAPAICKSAWHESQTFVLEYGGHRFFAMQ